MIVRLALFLSIVALVGVGCTRRDPGLSVLQQHHEASQSGRASGETTGDRQRDVTFPVNGLSFQGLSTKLWPDGKIPYHIVDVTGDNKDAILAGMRMWERKTGVVHFSPCEPQAQSFHAGCPFPYLKIRYNTDAEEAARDDPAHSCSLGYVSSPKLRLIQNSQISLSTALHELGHCIGVGHEHSRADNDRWLPLGTSLGELAVEKLPLVGNFAYDSILHYSQIKLNDVVHKVKDYFGHELLWQGQLSPWDVARVQQYYAYQANDKWGMFMSLNGIPNASNALPDPYLAYTTDGTSVLGKVSAVGSPAISYEQPGAFDLFVLGTDKRLYWKSIRQTQVTDWRPLNGDGVGPSFGLHSEPAAISMYYGWIDVFVIDASGRLLQRSYRHQQWGAWRVVAGGAPVGGIAQHSDGLFLGPAVATRIDGTLDVFVVRKDGRLATIHLASGSWGSWQTLGATLAYTVKARPAALGVSTSRVQLAINAGSGQLYEPTLDVLSTTGALSFQLGPVKAQMRPETPPALARRDDATHPYRVLIVDADGHLAHRFAASSTWRKIGGVLREKTGPVAVAEGSYGAWIAMHGPDALGCNTNCKDPSKAGQIIQPGGLWLRRFK